MLQILKAKDVTPYLEKINALNLGEKTVEVSEAVDGDKIDGYVFYHFEEDFVVLDYLEFYGDFNIFDGMIRSVVFLAMLKGVDKAEFRLDESLNDDLKRFRFVKDESMRIDSISAFLDTCKNCKKV